jgi:hypothetical protein
VIGEGGELIVYRSEDGRTHVQLRAVEGTVWLTQAPVLREYLVKGFVLDDRRLKDPRGTDYFDELLERIRDIRASEKRFYQKVRDVFAASSIDYDGTSDAARMTCAS